MSSCAVVDADEERRDEAEDEDLVARGSLRGVEPTKAEGVGALDECCAVCAVDRRRRLQLERDALEEAVALEDDGFLGVFLDDDEEVFLDLLCFLARLDSFSRRFIMRCISRRSRAC